MASAAATGGGSGDVIAKHNACTRKKPNVLVTGTPGSGKTTLCEALRDNVGFKIKDKEFHGGHDKEFDALILDEDSEDKLLDEMEEILGPGGYVVEFHSIDLFPERWFDLVVVLTTDNTELFDRLTRRGYSDKKIEENVTAEIMQVCLDEARESFAREVVVPLSSNTTADCDSNVQRIEAWAAQWLADAPKRKAAAAAAAAAVGAAP